MTTQPTWTWRLRADAADRWYWRWWYRFLRLCSDSENNVDRLAIAAGLVLSIGFVLVYLSSAKDLPVAAYTVGLVAILLALKGLVAHAARLVFRDQTIIGGAPTTYRFDNLVPQSAERVALVGQNLASRFDDKYEATVEGIRTLLSRRDSGNILKVEQIWLVLQTPLALLAVHPDAARHLCAVTLRALQRLASDINDDRVKVAFHPATTLSMIVVDWHRDSRLAVISPKMQTIPIIERRLSLVLSSALFDTVAPHFDRFLSETLSREFPGACAAPLSKAASVLGELFGLDIVQAVNKYVQDEENRVRRISCIDAS
jgi:hypothetical protein